MRKLLSKPTPHEAATVTGETPPAVVAARPSGRQDAVYQAGVPIAAIDASPDGRAAVLGGRHVLKTVRLEGLVVREGVDLRALITAQQQAAATTRAAGGGGGGTGSLADQLSIRDVKWARGAGETRLFTACLAGKIFQYDLGRLGTGTANGGIDTVLTQEDSRQINTLDPNPHSGTFLLAGGQDGVVRLLDTRTAVPARSGPTFRSKSVFRCHADAVRRVQWSPCNGFYFAAGTEQGVVLKWDLRKPAAPVLRLNAHDRACTTLAWHPDGDHLLTGGADRACRVWDVSRTADRRQRAALHTIATAAPVAAVAWRPPQWSASAGGLRAAQIAVSYDSPHAGFAPVHIWDLARPTLPYRVLERFAISPMALRWRSAALLWTAGQDGLFAQCDVAYAPRVVDRTAFGTLAFSPCGDLLTCLEERPPARPRFVDASGAAASASVSVSATAPSAVTTITRSDSEDDGVRTFLRPRRTRTRRSSAAPLAATPPSSGSSAPPGSASPQQTADADWTTTASAATPLLSLEQALAATGMYRPQQIMAIGHVPAATRPDLYGYLAAHYIDALVAHGGLPGTPLDETAAATAALARPLPDRVAAVLACFAQAAEAASQFRLAQVWRILAFAVDLLLRRREEYHRHVDDSTSKMPTPLARPADRRSLSARTVPPLALPAPHGASSAPPPRRHLDSMPFSETSEATHLSSQDGYDFYDTEALARGPETPVTRHDEDPFFPLSQGDSYNNQHSQYSQGSASSNPPARVARLNRTLLALRWSGSDLAGAPSIVDDTYYPTQSSYRDRSQDSAPSVSADFGPPIHDAASPSSSSSSSSSSSPVDYPFLPWPDDPPFPFTTAPVPSALDPYIIVRRALDFETRSSPLHAAAMVLLLRPLMPSSVLDARQAAAIVRQHHGRLMGMRLFLAAARLRKLLAPTVRDEPPVTDDGPLPGSYRPITAQAQHGVAVGYTCPVCRKAFERSPPTSSGTAGGASPPWHCPRCTAVMAPCAVCGHRDAAPLAPGPAGVVLSTWWYCVACAHGGHSTCLTRWHADPDADGCCPLDGCAHACLPGRWRADAAVARADDLATALREGDRERERERETSLTGPPPLVSRASAPALLRSDFYDVRADGLEAAPSRAVDVVRDALANRDQGRLLGTSPGRERRKSVKFVGE